MVSIVICTYNRLASLIRVVEDLPAAIALPGRPVEVWIVDNNSSDGTAEAMQERIRSAPFPLRYVREERQGLSHARNRGIAEAGGAWIVFTDDDVRLEAGWLAALLDGLEACGAPAGGGRVLPIWPERLPRWVATQGRYLQDGVFLNYDLGPGARLLGDDEEFPFGCNMAFRAELFRQHGLFRTDLGRTGKRLMSGEDTEMFERLRRAGVPLGYVGDAVVRHPVEAARLSLGYLARWKYWNGFRAGREAIPKGRTLAGVPLYIYRHLAMESLRCLRYALAGRPEAAAFEFGRACGRAGYIAGRRAGRRALRLSGTDGSVASVRSV